VKRTMFRAIALALFVNVVTLSSDAWSQSKEPAATALPHKVGLIDMAHVFKNYKKFEALRDELKDEIAASEEQAKSMQEELLALQKAMKALVEGSPEFAKAEPQYVKMAGEFETFRRSASREFLKKESQIYLQVYNETSDAVSKYATHFKYTLVLRFNREDLDTENPQNLLQGMNRQVVYHKAEDDITVDVLNHLNKQFTKAASTPAAAPSATTPPARRETKKPAATSKN